MVVLVKEEFAMKNRLRLCFAILRLWLYLLSHGWTFCLEEICGGAMLRAPLRTSRFGLFGLAGLYGLGTVWNRFTRCGFWGKKGRKIGLHGLERFTAGRRVNRFGHGIGGMSVSGIRLLTSAVTGCFGARKLFLDFWTMDSLCPTPPGRISA